MKRLSRSAMVQRVLTAVAISFFLAPLATSAAGLVVIVNPDSGVEKLSREEIIQFYMGRTKKMPGGEAVAMIDVDASREAFYYALLGRDIAEINAYWARLKFSGQTQPPQLLSSDEAAVERVARQRNAIAYVDANKVDKRVRVVLKLDH